MVSPHAEHHRLELACVFACSPHPTPVPDVAKGKAATQRVFTIIDRQPLIDAASQVNWRVCAVCGGTVLRHAVAPIVAWGCAWPPVPYGASHPTRPLHSRCAHTGGLPAAGVPGRGGAARRDLCLPAAARCRGALRCPALQCSVQVGTWLPHICKSSFQAAHLPE